MHQFTKMKFAFTFLLLSSVLTINAQKFNVSWSQDPKERSSFIDAIQLDNGNMIILKVKPKTRMGEVINETPVLTLINKNMETVKESEIPVEGMLNYVKGFLKMGKRIYLVYSNGYPGRGKLDVYFSEINIDDLTAANKESVISVKYGFMGKPPDYKFVLSPDSTKLLVLLESTGKPKEDRNFNITVFDQSLKKLWEQEAQIPFERRLTFLYDTDISNQGTVYVSLKQSEKEIQWNVLKGKEKNLPPSYNCLIYSYAANKKENKDVRIKIEKKYVVDTKLIFNEEGNATVSGLYKNDYEGSVKGIFYATFTAANPVTTNAKLADFPSDLVNLVINDKFGGIHSDPGLSIYFKLKDIKYRENGIDLISEYNRVIVSTQAKSGGYSETTTEYIYGDIVVAHIGNDGKTTFTRVPKNQDDVGIGAFFGFYAAVYKDKLILFYNDDKDNIDRDLSKKPDDISKFKSSIFIAAIVGMDGSLTRKAVYENKDENLIAVPHSMAKVTQSKYLITANSGKVMKDRSKFGTIEIGD